MTPETFEQYRTDIPSLDQCHWNLLQMLVDAAIDYKYNRDVRQLKLLAKLLIDHHIEEEQMMSDENYPHIEAHKHSHDTLTFHLVNMIYRCLHDPDYTDITQDFERFFVSHIEHYDLQFSTWLKNKHYMMSRIVDIIGK